MAWKDILLIMFINELYVLYFTKHIKDSEGEDIGLLIMLVPKALYNLFVLFIVSKTLDNAEI